MTFPALKYERVQNRRTAENVKLVSVKALTFTNQIRFCHLLFFQQLSSNDLTKREPSACNYYALQLKLIGFTEDLKGWQQFCNCHNQN